MSIFAKAKQAKENKKGFTLVELIVVIVIIAILAAITVPALTGYIDRARNQQVLADGRSLFVATQALATENYAMKAATLKPTQDAVLKLSGLGTLPTGATLAYEVAADGKVTSFEYKVGNVTIEAPNGVVAVKK